MQKTCEDSYSTTFCSFKDMQRYHEDLTSESQWIRCKINELHIEPLDQASSLYGTPSSFAPGVSTEAVEDTAQNLGLAMRIGSDYYPIRTTAYKSLLARAKIGGTVLPKLSREKLARTLNDCLAIYSSEALLLIRDEKVSAAHSGNPVDYSVLPIDELLKALTRKLDDRFSGSEFQSGYSDHALTSASWTMPGQKEELLDAYEKVLIAQGKTTMASKLMPGIRFVTSDVGVASAKVSALLMGTQYPIHIGGCVAVDHCNQAKVENFEDVLDQLFAQFQDSVGKLQKLLDIGGFTTDVLLLRNGKPDLQFCRSLESGVITMNNDIIRKISAQHDMKIEDEHISAVLQGRETILPEDVKKTIRESAQLHAKEILDQLRELQVDLRTNPAIFIGGGSSLFRPLLEQSSMVAQASYVEDPKANAIGYEMMAKQQLSRMV